jgi:hypothetical protein
MRKLILLCMSLCVIALSGAGAPAFGQAFVASNGLDTNACTQTAPCATFAHAYSQTNPGGSITCLDSGQYATTTLTITGSITIDCGDGNIGRTDLSGGGTIGININASSAANIVLRHLNINGVNTATNINGVVTTSLPGGNLVIEDSIVSGFTGTGSNGNGIQFTPTGSGRSALSLTNVRVYANNTGVSVAPSGGQIASVLFTNTNVAGNTGDGVDLAGAGVIAGDMRQGVLAANGVNGLLASSAGGVFFTLEGSTVIANLGVGIETNSTAADVNVAASTIGGNGIGVRSLAGSLISFGDNHISANGSNGAFTSETPLK